MKRLQDISIIRTGYNFRSISSTSLQTVRLISAKDLASNFTDADEVRIPDSYKNYLQDGDILVKSRGPFYEAKVFTNPNQSSKYVATNTLIVVRLTTKDYKPSYITEIINAPGSQRFLRSLSSGQTVSILSPSSLGLLNCPQTPLAEQDQLEIITKTIDDYQITITKYKETSDKLTKALKNELIKGVK